MDDPGYRSPQQQIDDCTLKMGAMLTNRENFFKQRDKLAKSIADGRALIAATKESLVTGDAASAQETIDSTRERVAGWIDDLDALQTPPPGVDSRQYAALRQRIADIRAQEAESARTAVTSLADPRVLNARAERQARVASELEGQAASDAKRAADIEAARLREIDGE